MAIEMRDCRACEGKHPSIVHDCPVCLGTGKVEAKPSVRDAMADAETLRKVYRTHYKPPKMGDGVFLPDRDMPTVIGWKPVMEVESITRHVARAAFRAIPALRGDR